MSQEEINSNLRRDKVVRRGKRQKLGIEGKNKTVGLSKQAKGSKQEKQRKILFWNIAGVERIWIFGVMSKDDFVSLCEAQLNEKGWDAVKNRLPKTHVWDCSILGSSYTRKERKRGRANGFIIGKRKGWENKEDRLISKE